MVEQPEEVKRQFRLILNKLGLNINRDELSLGLAPLSDDCQIVDWFRTTFLRGPDLH